MEFPELHTKRLRLRALQPADADAFYELYSHPMVGSFIRMTPLQDKAEAAMLIDKHLSNFEAGKEVIWVGERLGEEKTLIGVIGFTNIGQDSAEFGGRLLPEYWAGGLAMEACQAVMAHAHKHMPIKKVIGLSDVKNRSALKLAALLGFKEVERLPDYAEFEGAHYDLIKMQRDL